MSAPPSPDDFPPPALPSPTGSGRGGDFVSAAYQSLSSDPAKLARLVNNIQAHQITEHLSTSLGASWIITDSPFGAAQLIRVDRARSTGLSGATTVRERLMGTYSTSSLIHPHSRSGQRRIKEIENGDEDESSGSGSGIGEIDTPHKDTYSTASITEIADDTSSRKKRKNRKKKKSKKSMLDTPTPTPTSPRTDAEEEEDEMSIELGRHQTGMEETVPGLGVAEEDDEGESGGEGDGEGEGVTAEGISEAVNYRTRTDIIQPTLPGNLHHLQQHNYNQTQSLTSLPLSSYSPSSSSHSHSHSPHHPLPPRPQSQLPSHTTSISKLSPNSLTFIPSSSVMMPSFGQALNPNVPAFTFGSIAPSSTPTQTQIQAHVDDHAHTNTHTISASSSDDENNDDAILTPLQPDADYSTFDPHLPPATPGAPDMIDDLTQEHEQPQAHEQITTQALALEPIIISAPTPPESPLVDAGIVLPDAVVKSHDPNEGKRPSTPPPDVPGSITDPLPVNPNLRISSNQAANFSPDQIPMITFGDHATVPLPTMVHPMSQGWTMYFSDTASQSRQPRKSPLGLGPSLSPTSSSADVYSSHLITLFCADTLEDLFGSWKALRRAIASSKSRVIEPLGDSSLKGGAGLGTHLFADNSNFHLFVRGVQPMWEDPMCQKGGKIMIAGDSLLMDELFFEIALLLISGELDSACFSPHAYPNNMILGVVLSRRKLTRLELWLGGELPPDQGWVKEITRFLEQRFMGQKVYAYKAFSKGA